MFKIPIVIKTSNGIIKMEIDDTICIFKSGNIIVYKLSPKRDIANNEKIIGSESFFSTCVDSKWGYLYTNISKIDSVMKLNADSFLNERAFKKFVVNQNPYDSLITSKTEKKNQIIIDKFIPKVGVSKEYFDTVIYTYSKKFHNLFYSFSKQKDSVRNMKLYKISYLNNKKYSEYYKSNMPKRGIYFEIKPIKLSELEKVRSTIEKLKKILIKLEYKN